MPKIFGYSAAALCKEIKRNSVNGQYQAQTAHNRASNRRARASQKKKKLAPKLEEYIFEKMQKYWSPEQVAGRLFVDFPDDCSMRISFKTIYRRIAKGRDPWCTLYPYLRLKRQRKSLRNKASRNGGPNSLLPSIDNRPSIGDAKSRFGDWESDLVCGAKGQGHIATFVERRTNYVLAAECPLRTPASYKKATLSVLGALPSDMVHTVTVDRGAEFYAYRELEEELGVNFYFCHPRCPNERGLNEQINGLLRQFFPKRKSLQDIGKELEKAVALLNNRPRKRLDYKTPVEMLSQLGFTHC